MKTSEDDNGGDAAAATAIGRDDGSRPDALGADDVFVSFPGECREWAGNFCNHLRELDLKPFLDDEDLPASATQLTERILSAVEHARLGTVVLVIPETLYRVWVLKESMHALYRGNGLHVVLLEPVDAESIRVLWNDPRRYDLYAGDGQNHYARLLRTLDKKRRPQNNGRPRPPAPPMPRWNGVRVRRGCVAVELKVTDLDALRELLSRMPKEQVLREIGRYLQANAGNGGTNT